MAHVLVFDDDRAIAEMLTMIFEDEGHVVTKVHTADDALMVLRTSLHPVVAFVGYDLHTYYRELDQEPAFFATIHDHPELYGLHRYIARCERFTEDDEEMKLIRSLGVSVLRIPFSLDRLLALVKEATASFS